MIILLTFSWFLMGGIAAYHAKKRGRNSLLWFAVGLSFGILGVILLFTLPSKKTLFIAPPSVPILPEKTDSPLFWYYVDQQHTPQGPMSSLAFEAAKKEGKLDPLSYVWNTEMDSWKRLKEI